MTSSAAFASALPGASAIPIDCVSEHWARTLSDLRAFCGVPPGHLGFASRSIRITCDGQ
jgi:hypothetical protein